VSKNRPSWIEIYNELMTRYCRPFISNAKLNASIRAVCKEMGPRCSTALPKTEIVNEVSEVLDSLVKSGRIDPEVAQIFKNNAELVFLCCTNVYQALRSKRFKAHMLELFKSIAPLSR
jgi:hypothetical protein